MDFILADMAPHPSGFPVDGGVRTDRAAPSRSSSGSRKSFPSVLQGARGEERRGETREADDGRSTNRSDREPRSRETKGQNPPSTPTERAEAASSQVQASDRGRSSDDEKRVAEDSMKPLESTNQPSHASSDSQGHATAPLLSGSHQVLAHADDQTNVHTEGEGHCSEGDHVSERKTESDGGSSRSAAISPRAINSSMTVSDPAEGHTLPDNEQSSQHDLLPHAPEAQVIHTGSDAHAAQAVKPGSHLVADDAGTADANLVESGSVPLESLPGSALPQPEAIGRRASQAHLGAGLSAGLSDGKPEIPQTNSVGVQVDRSTPAQINWYAQFLSNDQDAEVKARWAVPQGQPSSFASFEELERFSEFGDDQHSPQHDQAETKLPQAAVVDRQVSSGQPEESIMAGAHGRAGSGAMPSPPNASFVSQGQPVAPVHDPAEPSVSVMTRSVVFGVERPDLGHVNIRVAMTNDVVHTHLSADRPEVGQFLINGQDRLQAAFQANGLDMGQFRVDIDRQGAGRSFQHGQSQEQGQTWDQGSQGTKWGQSPDRQDEQRTSLHGLLNVVA